MSVHQLLYISTAHAPFDDAALLDLVVRAREANGKAGITGLLLYSSGNFIQLLEGETVAVQALAAKIERDPRHHGFLRLTNRPCEARLFPAWAMGVAPTSGTSAENLAEFSTFVADVRSGKITASPTDRTPMTLLQRFATHVGR